MNKNVLTHYHVTKTFWNIAFLTPALILFFLFVILPFIQGIPYSLTDWDGFSKTSKFVGLRNYQFMLMDGKALNSTINTLQFTVVTVIFANLFGLLIALGIKKSSFFNNALRTINFMPFVISLVLTAFIWSYIYSDVFYAIFGLKSILGSSANVMYGLAFMSVWRDAGYCMVVYIAALQGIPQDYFEVADIEGANALQRFHKIILPLIVPAFTANFSLLLSWGLKVFDYPFAATGGGPGDASMTINMYIYNNIFSYFKAGYGQAVAIVFTIAIFILTTTVAKIFRSREVEM